MVLCVRDNSLTGISLDGTFHGALMSAYSLNSLHVNRSLSFTHNIYAYMAINSFSFPRKSLLSTQHAVDSRGAGGRGGGGGRLLVDV